MYGQIKNRYPMDIWQEIVGNCDTRISLACTDILSAEYFSNLLGVATVENTAIRKDAGFDGAIDYGQKNITNIQRKLLNPDEILRLQSNKVLVILRGNKPILLDKMIYTEHPLAKELKDSPVSEYIPEWQKTKSTILKEISKDKKKTNKMKSFIDF